MEWTAHAPRIMPHPVGEIAPGVLTKILQATGK